MTQLLFGVWLTLVLLITPIINVLLYIVRYLVPDFSEESGRGIGMGVAGISFILALTLIIWLATRYKKRALQVAHTIKLPLLAPQLIVRAAADEASTFLTTCQAGVWLIHKMLMVMLLPVLAAEKFGSRIAKAQYTIYEHSPMITLAISTLAVGLWSLLSILINPWLVWSKVPDSIIWQVLGIFSTVP